MGIEESEHNMKQQWSLLDPMVYLFDKIEEGLEFSVAANTPIPEGKVVNIAYPLILRTGGIEKLCEQWGNMQVGLNNWKDLKNHF